MLLRGDISVLGSWSSYAQCPFCILIWKAFSHMFNRLQVILSSCNSLRSTCNFTIFLPPKKTEMLASESGVVVCVLVAQSCLTLYNPVDCSLSGSSVHGIFQARILEWVAISYSRGSSQPRDRTWVSCIAGRFFKV